MKSKIIIIAIILVALSVESCRPCQRRKRQYFKRYVTVEQPVKTVA